MLLVATAREFHRRGWDVHIVANSRGEAWPSLEDYATFHAIPMSRRPSPLKDVVALLGWCRLFLNLQVDVAIVGTPKAALLAMVSAKFCGVKKRVYHLRGLRLETESPFRKPFLRMLERLTSFCASEVLAVSNTLATVYLDSNLAPKRKVVVLGKGSSHGVDLEHYNPGKWTNWIPNEVSLLSLIDREVLVLGYVGRVSRDKGFGCLAELQDRLIDNGVDHEIVIVGPIEAELKELGIFRQPPIFLGEVRDPAPYYSLFDLILLPTKREGFPNAILEAGSSGVPAVTTDATGAIDSVIPGITGLIARAGDCGSFADQVIELAKDPERRNRMGMAARDWISQNFDEKLVVGLLCDYCDGLLVTGRYG